MAQIKTRYFMSKKICLQTVFFKIQMIYLEKISTGTKIALITLLSRIYEYSESKWNISKQLKFYTINDLYKLNSHASHPQIYYTIYPLLALLKFYFQGYLNKLKSKTIFTFKRLVLAKATSKFCKTIREPLITFFN